ncbi:MAG: general stress protein [Gemmatimonadaceae bacterium]
MANTAVFGLYATRADVEEAIEQLRLEGFRNADISVLMPDNQGTKDLAHEKATKAPEGIAAGATSGAVLGGTLGWLVGIGALAIPGLGPFVAAGPIMAALGGVGVGATVGGLTGALVGIGIPEYEAKRYEGRIKGGNILVSVHSDNSDWTDKAKRILRGTGAADVAAASEAKGDFANSERPHTRAADSRVDRPGIPREEPRAEL